MIGITAPKARIAVTIDTEVPARVESTVAAGEARSVSAYVEHAVASQLAAETSFDATPETTVGHPT